MVMGYMSESLFQVQPNLISGKPILLTRSGAAPRALGN